MELNTFTTAHITLAVIVAVLAIVLVALAKKSARFIAFLYSKPKFRNGINETDEV